MGWKQDTPSENALIWNPAYIGKDGSKEMAGQIGDYLSGVCLEVNRVPSNTNKGEDEFRIIIGSDGVKQAVATLKGLQVISDQGFLFICGKSRWQLGSTFVKGRFYYIALKELKDVGQPYKYAIYERLKDDEYVSPVTAQESVEAPLPF